MPPKIAARSPGRRSTIQQRGSKEGRWRTPAARPPSRSSRRPSSSSIVGQRGKPAVAADAREAAPHRAGRAATSKANAVIALAASPWAPLVAVGGQKQVLLYHGDTMRPASASCRSRRARSTCSSSAATAALLLAGGGRGGQSGKVVVLDVKTGERDLRGRQGVRRRPRRRHQRRPAAQSPWAGRARWSASTRPDGSLVREIKKHTDWVYAVEFSPDGVLLATGDRTGGLIVWEAATGREFFDLRGPHGRRSPT